MHSRLISSREFKKTKYNNILISLIIFYYFFYFFNPRIFFFLVVVCPISCGQPQTQSLSLSRSFLLSSFLLSHHHLINLLSSSSVFLHHWFAHRYSLFSLLFFILPSLSFFTLSLYCLVLCLHLPSPLYCVSLPAGSPHRFTLTQPQSCWLQCLLFLPEYLLFVLYIPYVLDC